MLMEGYNEWHRKVWPELQAHIRRIGADFLPKTIVLIEAHPPAHTRRATETMVFPPLSF